MAYFVTYVCMYFYFSNHHFVVLVGTRSKPLLYGSVIFHRCLRVADCFFVGNNKSHCLSLLSRCQECPPACTHLLANLWPESRGSPPHLFGVSCGMSLPQHPARWPPDFGVYVLPLPPVPADRVTCLLLQKVLSPPFQAGAPVLGEGALRGGEAGSLIRATEDVPRSGRVSLVAGPLTPAWPDTAAETALAAAWRAPGAPLPAPLLRLVCHLRCRRLLASASASLLWPAGASPTLRGRLSGGKGRQAEPGVPGVSAQPCGQGEAVPRGCCWAAAAAQTTAPC